MVKTSKRVKIAGKSTSVQDIINYVNFLRGSHIIAKRMGIQSFEYERARLHNKIFHSAGFKDTKWGTARKTAAWFETMTFRDTSMKKEVGYNKDLVDFKDALDNVIGKLLEK
jgi:hypothetical protein